jgi:hypothetical protein
VGTVVRHRRPGVLAGAVALGRRASGAEPWLRRRAALSGLPGGAAGSAASTNSPPLGVPPSGAPSTLGARRRRHCRIPGGHSRPLTMRADKTWTAMDAARDARLSRWLSCNASTLEVSSVRPLRANPPMTDCCPRSKAASTEATRDPATATRLAHATLGGCPIGAAYAAKRLASCAVPPRVTGWPGRHQHGRGD